MEVTKEGIVTTEFVGTVKVVSFLSGRIREEREVFKALEELGQYIEANPGSKVLINLKSIEYLSSAGLGLLVGLLKKSRKTGGQFKLCSLQETIYELFEVMRLTKIFEIFENQNEALKAFNT
ncbi:MAG: anti-sigma factor antagonist [Planctomycetes bacterium]|nr:anti-sigma factor antagonist [Planctomycetota bacterium]